MRGNLRIVKEKPTRKAWFSHKKKRLVPRIYQAKFCLEAFLWNQRNLYYIFTRSRCLNGGEYICKDLVWKTTRVATRHNTTQHETTRVQHNITRDSTSTTRHNTSATRHNTRQHECNTRQHKYSTTQHEYNKA